MEEQEQLIVDEDALNVFSLFPKRQKPPMSLSLPQYSRVYENLICFLCKELLLIPVYLKCSHRFCKDCIEKYIRSSPRKSCPNCKGVLNSKRDLRFDSNLQSFITLAFGTVKRGPRRYDPIEEEPDKIPQLRKAESQIDLKSKMRVENAEQPVASVTSLRRAKTVDGEETRPKKRAPSEKKIKAANGGDSEREMTPSRRSKLAAQLRQIKKEFIDPPIERKKRRSNVMVIEIESSQPAEVQEIPREEFQIEENSIAEPTKLVPPLCSISIIPEVSEMDSARKIISMRDIQREENAQPDPPPERMEEEVRVRPPAISPEVLAARQALQQQFGGNFLNNIIELTDFPILMRVCIAKHPSKPFTPDAGFTQLKVIAKATAGTISAIIAEEFNINKEAIKLSVCEDNLNNFIEVGNATKLQEINNRFWRSFGGFEILELGNYSQSITNDVSFLKLDDSAWRNRILYYFVDYTKIAN